jgi:glycosyltransferase involved in cell wall biosynthesis
MNDKMKAIAEASPDVPGRVGPAVRLAPVSVVVPCFRCAATIDDAIASIVGQTARPAEVLLVEDFSGDDTLATLHRIAAAHEPGWIKVIAMPDNGGPSRARNAGWQQAAHPYIAFLDADDTWAPCKLELQMEVLEADPAIALIAHPMVVRMRGTALPAVRPPVRTEIVGRRRVLLHNPFPTASVVVRRDLPLRFDESFRRSEDFLLWAQIVLSGYRCARINQVLAIWNRRADGASGLSDDFAAMRRTNNEARRKLLQQGLLSRPEYEFTRAVSVLRWARRDLVLRLQQQGPYRPKPA